MFSPVLSPRPFSLKRFRGIFVGAAVLLGLLWGAYGNSFEVPFLLDDHEAIAENATLRSWRTALFPPVDSGITVSGRPILNLSFAINYALHGQGIVGYHVLNLLIHWGAGVILWRIVSRTLQLPGVKVRLGKSAELVGWLVAAAWALHPLQTAAVTYIVQRAESLAGLFYLLTLYAFIRRTSPGGASWWTWVMGIVCAAGMATKEIVATVPLVILLYDRAFVSGSFRESWRRNRRCYQVLLFSWLVLAACIYQSGARAESVGYGQIQWWQYAVTQGPALLGYAVRAVWPTNLIFDYGAVVEPVNGQTIAAGVVVLCVLGVAIYMTAIRPRVGFLIAGFFIVIAPSSSVIPVATQTVAEHRMYLPLIPFVIAFAALVRRLPPALWGAMWIIVLSAEVVRTYDRNDDYQSERAIWEDTVRRVPDNPRALNNYGSTLYHAGAFESSLPPLEQAVALLPTYDNAWYNLGCSLAKLGRWDDAAAALLRAIELNPSRSLYHAALGNAYYEQGSLDAALAAYRHAVATDDCEGEDIYNLANLLLKLDRMEEVEVLLAQGLERFGNDGKLWGINAVRLKRQGRLSDALASLEEAVRREPDSPVFLAEKGVLLLLAGKAEAAIAPLQKAVLLSPETWGARRNLAVALSDCSRDEEAVAVLRKLTEEQPHIADYWVDLGIVYARAGRFAEALTAFDQALGLDASHETARLYRAKVEERLR